ncbi:MAG: tetratricopeptide repeat protein [Anaerolineales bacterium]
MHRGGHRFALLGFALAVSGSACSSIFAERATATATHVPSATFTPTPTPTPTPATATLLEGADIALFEADWDTALAQYQEALAGAVDPETRAAALLGIATTHLRAGRYPEALTAFDGFLQAFPADPLSPEAHFLAALAYEETGQDDAALAAYDQYLALRPGVIDADVQERAGDTLRRLGRPMEAIPRYQAGLAASPLHGPLNLQTKIGVTYLNAELFAEALSQFETLFATASDSNTLATMNYLAGLALQGMGQNQAAYERYLDSVIRFPESADTYSGLVILVGESVPVDDYLRGLIDFHAGAYEPARDALDRILATNPTAAALYYRGLSVRALDDWASARLNFEAVVSDFPGDPLRPAAWREQAVTEWAYLGNYGLAVETYLELAAAYPGTDAGAQALFDGGRVAERNGDLGTAAQTWLRLAAEYPMTPLGYRGAFEGGVVEYRLGDMPAARSAFEAALSFAVEPDQRAASLLWIGKSQAAAGDGAAAALSWQAAAGADPTGYYSLRAEEIQTGELPLQGSGLFNFTTDLAGERAAAEAWLRQNFVVDGAEPLTELDGVLAADPRLIRGEELWRLGLFGEARDELESLRLDVATDPEATYRLMHKLLDLRLYRSAIFASRQILSLAGMDDRESLGAPVYFNRIRFGPYFGELILPEAVRYGLDGLFLLSLVRQESLFEGFATSFADARGLMQVIPPTGQSIAEQLGWPPDYVEADLYRPVVSVRFGTFYIAEQRDRFEGDLPAALAAYNAGPGNALIWRELAGGDPDLFVEVIRLQEPYDYIRTITEVYAIYRTLYASP